MARRTIPVALGLRVKSGWAACVVLGGPPDAPRFLGRRLVELADPKVPRTWQPYHAGFGTLEKDAAILRRLAGLVQRATQRSLSAVVRDCRARGQAPRGLGLVVGSVGDPERIGNEHIRAHACEGRLFRTALERAARRHHLPCRVLLERGLLATAGRELVISDQAVRRAATSLGREAGTPWRSEEKAAAVAAWLILARTPSARSSTPRDLL